jgi:hypothetical protein
MSIHTFCCRRAQHWHNICCEPGEVVALDSRLPPRCRHCLLLDRYGGGIDSRMRALRSTHGR